MKRTLFFLLTLVSLWYIGARYADTNTPQPPLMFNSFIKSLSSAFHGAPKAAPTTNNVQSYGGGVVYNPATQNIDTIHNNNSTSPLVNVSPYFNQPSSSTQGSVLGANYSPYSPSTGNYGGSGVSYGGSTGGYGTTAASPDTTGLQDQARSLISSIQNAYHGLQGTITPVIQDKVNQYLQNYDTQTQDLNKSYGNTVGQTQNLFGARGLGDSSFQGNALDGANQTYQQNLGAINQDKSTQLGAIGQYAKGLTANANQQADSYNQYLPNLGQYSASDLTSLNGQLQSSLGSAQSQMGSMGTNQNFLDTLNQYAPNANQGSAQLAQKLQQLTTSSAPIFAKKQIAAGLVKSANLQDPNAQSYWQNYYQNLLSGSA